MPPLIRREPLRSKAYLCRHTQLEFIICDLQEGQKFADEDANVVLVDQRVRQLERTPADGDVPVAKTVKDDVAMTLDGIGVY